MNTIGAVGARPGTGASSSGPWIFTSFTASLGTVIGFLHFGQGPVRPANLSLTLNVDRQPGQMT